MSKEEVKKIEQPLDAWQMEYVFQMRLKELSISDIKTILDSKTDEERLELISSYCKHCVSKDAKCQRCDDE